MITGGNLYDDYDPDRFDETTEELAYRLPASYISPEVDLDDPMRR
ncbi:MAG TPA: hypothetical protein VGD57_09830 [Candidatus Dormibacteraeota bacterium]|jgi:hypothetical protein